MLLSLLLVGIALLAGGVTVTLVELTRRWALARGWLDRPNARSSHAVPTPRLGGLGVTATLTGGLLVWGGLLPASVAPPPTALLAVVAAALGVAALSLWDDFRPLAAAVRLPAHLAAATVIAMATGGISVVAAGSLGAVSLAPVWSVLLAVVWIAWFLNAFNFMDGIDGIAGGQALVAGLTWIGLGLLEPSPALSGAGAVMVGASFGFLVHNWAPARIFLGDVGSAPLGLLLASVPWALGPSHLWLVSLLPLWPFLFDTAVTLVRRAVRGEQVWLAHRSHLYQRLVILGWSHRAVATLYTGLAALGAAAALLAPHAAASVVATWLGMVAVGAAGLWVTVAVAERGAAPGPAPAARGRFDA